MRWWHLRLVVNLVNLSTPFGLLVGLVGRCRFSRGPRGLVLATSYRWSFPTGRAFTIGNVILSRKRIEELVPEQRLLAHEERHTWQYVACLGLPMLPLYVLALGWSMARGGDRSTYNLFERLAGLEDGGYPTVSRRAQQRPH